MIKRKKLLNSIKANGWSVNELAEALGYHKTSIYAHLNGRADMRLPTAKKLVKLLDNNITLTDVYED